MRPKRWLAVLALVGAMAAGWALLRDSRPAPRVSDQRAVARGGGKTASPGLIDWLARAAAPEPGLSLRGVVLANGELLPGADVVLTPYREPGGLSGAPCPCADALELRLLDDLCGCDECFPPLVEWLVGPALSPAPVAHATTDAEGSFVITGLAEALYVLSAEHPVAGAAVLAAVAPGGVEVEIHLEATTPLTIEVVDPDLEPLPDAAVTLVHAASGQIQRARSDAAGEVVLKVHDADLYYAVAQGPGLLPTFEVRTPGEAAIELWLDAARRLAGVVLDADGDPAEGVAVRLRGEDTAAETLSDGDGRFAFNEVRPGDYFLVAVEGDLHAGKLLTLSSDRDRERVELRLARVEGAALAGVIRDAVGQPLAGARVVAECTYPWGTEVAVTDADGRYRLGPLPPGMVDVEVSAVGRARACGMAEIAVGETATLDLELALAAPLVGRLWHPSGRPVAGLILRLEATSIEGSDDPLAAGALGDEDLDAPEAEDLEAGDLEAGDLEAEDLEAEDLEAGDLEAGDLDDEDLDDDEVGAVAWAEASPCEVFLASTGFDGAFSFNGVPPGTYEVWGEELGEPLLLGQVEVPGDALELVLEEAAGEQGDDELETAPDETELLAYLEEARAEHRAAMESLDATVAETVPAGEPVALDAENDLLASLAGADLDDDVRPLGYSTLRIDLDALPTLDEGAMADEQDPDPDELAVLDDESSDEDVW